VKLSAVVPLERRGRGWAGETGRMQNFSSIENTLSLKDMKKILKDKKQIGDLLRSNKVGWYDREFLLYYLLFIFLYY
jgi:hypothetical protein